MATHWTSSLATGISQIDTEHYDFLERMDQVMHGGHGARNVDDACRLLLYLETHVLHHFVEEEDCMLRADYPDVLQHRAEHGRLTELVINLHQGIARGTDIDSVAASNRLICNWLVMHVSTADRAFADFLRAHP